MLLFKGNSYPDFKIFFHLLCINLIRIACSFTVLRFNSFNDEHPQNMQYILITLLVLKLLRFNSFNDEHPENILFI